MKPNYVIFQRGQKEIFNRLKSLHKLNKDVLYFVYENEEDDIGILYMGEKLISTNVISPISLIDLKDIDLNSDSLADGDVLSYNLELGKWQNLSYEKSQFFWEEIESLNNGDENE